MAPLKYSPLAATHTVSTYTVVLTISGVQSVTCSNKIFATAFFSQLLFYGWGKNCMQEHQEHHLLQPWPATNIFMMLPFQPSYWIILVFAVMVKSIKRPQLQQFRSLNTWTFIYFEGHERNTRFCWRSLDLCLLCWNAFGYCTAPTSAFLIQWVGRHKASSEVYWDWHGNY